MFKVGDEVVCIDSTHCCELLTRGGTYQVVACVACSICGPSIAIDHSINHFCTWRFVRLPKLTVDQEDEVTA